MNETTNPETDQDLTDASSVDFLVSIIDAAPVRIFQVSATRLENPPTEDELDGTSHDIAVALKLDSTPNYLEIRVKCELNRPDVDATVDVGIQFSWEHPVRYVDDKLVQAFARDFGISYTIAYVRPLLDQLTRTLELPTSMIPAVLNLGSSRNESENPDPAQA